MATVVQDEEYDLDEEGLEETRPANEYSPEQERAILSFAKKFKPNQKDGILHHMEHFFKNKMLHCGGKIPHKLLFCERRVSMATNYNISDAVIRAYKSLKAMLPAEKVGMQFSGEPTADIKLVNETLYLMSQSGIPFQYAGGMMLLYLEFVEGVDIGPEGWVPSSAAPATET